MVQNPYKRFEKLCFEDFRQMATDTSLSQYEKIGFPNRYREGKEHLIFEDICAKLPQLQSTGKVILDIGPGCSELPQMLIALCRQNEHTLVLVDSEEMLQQLPDEPFIIKIPGYYPYIDSLFEQYTGKVDVFLTYSVFHYVFVESNPWDFLDRSLELLAHGGELLIGDIPNNSKRKRFFSSPVGIQFHQAFMNTSEEPSVIFNNIERQTIDDTVMFSLISRARLQGYDAYILPQMPELPMANRREDILIQRP